jgi:hypothetical protein
VTKLNREQDVIRMAAELGLDWKVDPVASIVDYCLAKIRTWLDEAPPVSTITELERLVCDRVQLHVEEFRSDAELHELVSRYTHLGEPIFQDLLDDFDEGTFATLLRRKAVTESAADLYVAVVDCRGSKASRRFFSRWHEIAHLLTIRRQLELPYHRSTSKPPLERLMDHIAGEIGFFPPLFRPAVERSVSSREPLTFATVDSVRRDFCPTASFHSTLIACVRNAKIPLVHVEAGMGLKVAEQTLVAARQGHLFASPRPAPKLRALVAVSNGAAKAVGLRIDRNMAVPSRSVIAVCFNEDHDPSEDVVGIEKLETWRHTNGDPVGYGPVRVEARRVGERAVAILQPVIASTRAGSRTMSAV